MNRGLTAALFLGGILATAIANAYYQNIQGIGISLGNIGYAGFDDEGDIMLRITLNAENLSATTFPVPRATANVYAGTTYIGYAEATEWQYIRADSVSPLVLIAHLGVDDVAPFLYALIANGDIPDDINIKGAVHILGYNLYFNTQVIQLAS